MRYADGPTAELSIDIAASTDDVWAVIADPSFPAEHSDELQSAVWDPDGPEACVGARILGHNINPAVGEWRTSSIVVEWDQPNGWSWAVGDDPATAAAQWWFRLEPIEVADATGAARSGTRLSQKVRLGPGPSGLTPAIEAMPDKEERIVERRLQGLSANVQANLDAVKAALESS